MELHLPRSAVPYILLQRLSLQRSGANVVRASRWTDQIHRIYESSGLLKRLYRWYILRIAPRTNSRRLSASYTAQLADELEEMRPSLPASPGAILDIGCGIGGIDALVYRHYADRGDPPELYLVDKSGISPEIVYSFHTKAAHYNSFALARELLTGNGVPDQRIHMIEADDFERTEVPPVGLALSTFALGFHFPVETYLDRVYDLLHPGGVLITDIRHRTDGLESMRRCFGDLSVISSDEEKSRACAVKSAGIR
jgi:SAM-dependent methyltransferase